MLIKLGQCTTHKWGILLHGWYLAMFLFFLPTGLTIKFSYHLASCLCCPFIVRTSAAHGTSGSVLAGSCTVNHTVVPGNKKPGCQGESRQSTRQNKLSAFTSAHSCLKQLWAGLMDDLKRTSWAQALYTFECLLRNKKYVHIIWSQNMLVTFSGLLENLKWSCEA